MSDSVSIEIPLQAFVNDPEAAKALIIAGTRAGLTLAIQRLERLEAEFGLTNSLSPCVTVKEAIGALRQMQPSPVTGS